MEAHNERDQKRRRIEVGGRISEAVYIPPPKTAVGTTTKTIDDYQRQNWDALKKSINGLINKVNSTNLKKVIPELFSENLIRGRGLFCRSVMKSQLAYPGFTPVFAALIAVVNSKFPQIGELLLKRVILQFKRAYKRNDKTLLLSAVKFIAHLMNQHVVHGLLGLELLTLLLENPSDDSVEIAVTFVLECGSTIHELCPRGLFGVMDRLRAILQEGDVEKRTQILIESCFGVKKGRFQHYPCVSPELDLVEDEDQLTHDISLISQVEIDPETDLDVFKPDSQFLENETRYEELKKTILGDHNESSEEESDEEEATKIEDETETNLVNLRREIYLTIMSSLGYEEAGNKLQKIIKMEPGKEMELSVMLVECCGQERTYGRYYGLLGQRLCTVNRIHRENLETCFREQYCMVHRLQTNKLRNVAKFFGHLLATDALPWNVLGYIRLTEEDTSSSGRIFVKILFQELAEQLGLKSLNERLSDETMQDCFESIFRIDSPKNTRFAINFFTAIGLGAITEDLRRYLKICRSQS